MKVLSDLQTRLRALNLIADADNIARILKILKMCADEKVFWSPYDFATDTFNTPNPVFHVGDAFSAGDDDAEQINIGDVDALYRVYEIYGYEGGLAWAARKRGTAVQPSPEYRTPNYVAARAML
jgi:hypothetical protein